MARGGKRGHKGGRKQFTNPQQLEMEKEKEEREKQWRRQRGEESSTDEDKKSGDESSSDESGSDVEFQGAAKAKSKSKTAPQESSSEEESSSDEEEERKAKGTEGLIEIANPNRVVKKTKKVSQLDQETDKPQLSRREREEIEKQKAKANYQKLHAAGKTDEARADLARLAIIRKQREDAAKKRDEEKKAREEAEKAKREAKTSKKK